MASIQNQAVDAAAVWLLAVYQVFKFLNLHCPLNVTAAAVLTISRVERCSYELTHLFIWNSTATDVSEGVNKQPRDLLTGLSTRRETMKQNGWHQRGPSSSNKPPPGRLLISRPDRCITGVTAGGFTPDCFSLIILNFIYDPSVVKQQLSPLHADCTKRIWRLLILIKVLVKSK